MTKKKKGGTPPLPKKKKGGAASHGGGTSLQPVGDDGGGSKLHGDVTQGLRKSKEALVPGDTHGGEARAGGGDKVKGGGSRVHGVAAHGSRLLNGEAAALGYKNSTKENSSTLAAGFLGKEGVSGIHAETRKVGASLAHEGDAASSRVKVSAGDGCGSLPHFAVPQGLAKPTDSRADLDGGSRVCGEVAKPTPLTVASIEAAALLVETEFSLGGQGGPRAEESRKVGGQGNVRRAGGSLACGDASAGESLVVSAAAASPFVGTVSHRTLADLGSASQQTHKDLGFSTDQDLEMVVVEEGDEFSDDNSLAEEEFPPLPNRQQPPNGAARAANGSAPPPLHGGMHGVRPNAWVNAPKKVFMNAGLGGELSFTPPTSSCVKIKVSEGLPKQAVWGWSLLGQYVGFHPGHFLINSMMKQWGVKSKYRVEEGWFIFQFESEEDQDKVLKGGPYFIHGKPMLLKHIPEKFAFNRRDVATIPLWVRMFGLSRTFWTPEVLGRIASHVGKPLFMDPVTDSRKRGSYARVLVEINFAEPIVREVCLAFDDGEMLDCTFLIENEPKYCKGCCSLGHEENECSFKLKKSGVGAASKRGRTRNRRQHATANAAARPSASPLVDRSGGAVSQAVPEAEVSVSSAFELPVTVANVVSAVLDDGEEEGSSDDGFSEEESVSGSEESDSGSEASHNSDCKRCASPVLSLASPEPVLQPVEVEEPPFQVVLTRSQKKEAVKKAKKLGAVLALPAHGKGSALGDPAYGFQKGVGKKDKVSS